MVLAVSSEHRHNSSRTDRSTFKAFTWSMSPPRTTALGEIGGPSTLPGSPPTFTSPGEAREATDRSPQPRRNFPRRPSGACKAGRPLGSPSGWPPILPSADLHPAFACPLARAEVRRRGLRSAYIPGGPGALPARSRPDPDPRSRAPTTGKEGSPPPRSGRTREGLLSEDASGACFRPPCP